MEKITAKISGLELKQGIKGRQWCSFNLTQKSKNWKGALGEGVAHTLGEGTVPEATGAPEGSGTGRYQCSQTAGKQPGTIN